MELKWAIIDHSEAHSQFSHASEISPVSSEAAETVLCWNFDESEYEPIRQLHYQVNSIAYAN